MKARTLTQSLSDRLDAGSITMRDAAVALHKAGTFNYIPSESQTEEYLRKCRREGRDMEVIGIRDLFLNNLAAFLASEKKDRDYLTHGHEYAHGQWKTVKDLEIVIVDGKFECHKYSEDGETFEVIPYSQIDDTTLVIWNQFIQKKMWCAPGFVMEKVFKI